MKTHTPYSPPNPLVEPVTMATFPSSVCAGKSDAIIGWFVMVDDASLGTLVFDSVIDTSSAKIQKESHWETPWTRCRRSLVLKESSSLRRVVL